MGFDFTVDSDAYDFCMTIANTMAQKYGISLEEAIKRINRLWVGDEIVGDDLIYHRLESWWADHIYDFYEDRLRDGTADVPREELIAKTQARWKR
jgi:hypothetical protein